MCLRRVNKDYEDLKQLYRRPADLTTLKQRNYVLLNIIF